MYHLARGTRMGRANADAATVQTLASCKLFAQFSSEELQDISSEFTRQEFGQLDLDSDHQDALISNLLVIESGSVESIYIPEGEISKATHFEPLPRGSLWGSTRLITNAQGGGWPFKLRSIGACSFLRIAPAVFARLCDEWPQLQAALLVHLLARESSLAARLASERARADDIATVLDRVESVAGMLLMASASGEQETIIQRRWLLRQTPSLRGAHVVELEQGYLDRRSDYEDRVRKMDDEYVRTQKFGTGQSRKTYERHISAAEYADLVRRVRGNLITKSRYTFPMGGAKSLNVDVFAGTLRGLVLAEADFADEEQAAKFEIPAWLAVQKEVTNDKRYGNAALAQNGRPHPQ